MSYLQMSCSEQYLIVVNDFYRFYKQHRYDYPDNFFTYLSDTPFKLRLSFNPHQKEWMFKD